MAENVSSIRQLPPRTPFRTQTPRAKSPQGQQGRGRNTLLRPWEFDFVGDVFKRIITEPWFSKDSIKRSEFALLCLRTYQAEAGTDALYRACERLARDKYTDPSSH